MEFVGFLGEVSTEGCGFEAEMNYWESDEASELRLPCLNAQPRLYFSGQMISTKTTALQ